MRELCFLIVLFFLNAPRTSTRNLFFFACSLLFWPFVATILPSSISAIVFTRLEDGGGARRNMGLFAMPFSLSQALDKPLL